MKTNGSARIGWGCALLSSLVLVMPAQAGLVSPQNAGAIVQALSPDEVGKAELESALESFRKGELDKTLQQLGEASDKYKTLPPGRVLLARLFLIAGNVPVARQILEQAAVDFPNNSSVYITFGNAALLETRLTDAEVHFEKATRMLAEEKLDAAVKNRALIDCYDGQSQVWEARLKWKEALVALESWQKIDPKNGRIAQRMSRALVFLDRFEDAVKSAKLATELEREFPPASTMIGMFFEAKGDRKRAEEWLTKSVQENPKDARAYEQLSSWLLSLERIKEAQNAAENAAAITPDAVSIKNLLATIAIFDKRFEQAETILTALVEKNPNNPVLLNNLAIALVEQSDSQKHTKALEIADKLAKFQRPELYSTIGRVFYRVGRVEDADKAFQQTVRAMNDRTPPDTLYYYAFVLADKGQLDTVKKILTKAVESKTNMVFRQEAKEWLERMSATP